MPGFYADTPEYIILTCGAETGFLTLQEAYAVGTSCVWTFYLSGSLRDMAWWCPRHSTYHRIAIWNSCTDPYRSLCVFEASLSYCFGLADGFEEWAASGVWDPVVDDSSPDADWFNFVMFRQWQIEQEYAW